MLKKAFATLGFQNQEFEEFKRCISKVPILAQCVNTEKDRVKRVISRPAAASAAYTPLLSGQDEGSCSQENLHREITKLNLEGDLQTRELITCYRNLRHNPEFNRQIEESRHKDVYKKICLLLDEPAQKAQERQQLYQRLDPDYVKKLKEQEAAWQQIQRQFNEEEKELEKSLEETIKRVGKDHPDTLESLKKLADFVYTNEDYNRALPLYEDCLSKSKRVLGDDHPDTLKLLKKLAVFYAGKGEFKRAEPLYKEIVARNKRILGDDHPDTLDSLSDLAVIKRGDTIGSRYGGRSKSKRNHKNKSFRSTRRRRYSRARGGKKIAASSSKTIKRRRKNAR